MINVGKKEEKNMLTHIQSQGACIPERREWSLDLMPKRRRGERRPRIFQTHGISVFLAKMGVFPPRNLAQLKDKMSSQITPTYLCVI